VRCGFAFVSPIEDRRGLIFDQPVASQPHLLTSTNLRDMIGLWECRRLPLADDWEAVRHNAVQALARLERWRRPPGRLLDAGCGWGLFLSVARERGWEVTGLEPLAGLAIFARAHFQLAVVTDVLRPGTFAADGFDAITAFQVFEHLPEPSGMLDRLWHCLRPGGVLLLEVPNMDTWSVQLLRRHHRHFVIDHVNFFGPATLRAFLERRGFQVLDTFRPTRSLSCRHLLVDWLALFAPATAKPLLQRLGQRLHGHRVRLNFGDIVTVVARKPEVGAV
jgi:SAM-dependent methyltransferase